MKLPTYKELLIRDVLDRRIMDPEVSRIVLSNPERLGEADKELQKRLFNEKLNFRDSINRRPPEIDEETYYDNQYFKENPGLKDLPIPVDEYGDMRPPTTEIFDYEKMWNKYGPWSRGIPKLHEQERNMREMPYMDPFFPDKGNYMENMPWQDDGSMEWIHRLFRNPRSA